jgi:hypothetical protein
MAIGLARSTTRGQRLLECDACGSVLRSLMATGDGVRRLAREGAFGVVVSPSFLETASIAPSP